MSTLKNRHRRTRRGGLTRHQEAARAYLRGEEVVGEADWQWVHLPLPRVRSTSP
jgi:hypothetical protein